MKILVTGTPGAGKTTLAKEICALHKVEHIDVSNYIIENKLYDKKDEKLDTMIFDKEKIKKHLINYLKNIDSYVIDTHSPLVVDFVKFDFVFLLKISTDLLYNRLRLRGYNQHKIKENINSEIFEVIEDHLSDIKFSYYLVGEQDGYLTKKDVFLHLENFMKTK